VTRDFVRRIDNDRVALHTTVNTDSCPQADCDAVVRRATDGWTTDPNALGVLQRPIAGFIFLAAAISASPSVMSPLRCFASPRL